ncbi:MAG: SpoIIE family protein phosphatase [Solirubrobacteraceae bacterium]
MNGEEQGKKPGIEHAGSPSGAWLPRTLDEILLQIRILLDVDGCAFQTIDWEAGHIRPAAAWFQTPEIRALLQPVIDRPYDPERGGITEAAIAVGEPMLLADIETWEGAERLRARLNDQLDASQAAGAWEWYRTSSFIACPVRTAEGRTLGVLALSSSPPLPALGPDHLRVTEVFARLAAVALERAELLEHQAERARTEEMLHRAAEAVTASLDLALVYESIVEQAAIIAEAPTVVLLSLDHITPTLRVVASKGTAAPLSSHRYPLDDGMMGAFGQSGEPYVSRPEDRDRFLPWAEVEDMRSLVHVPLSLGPRRFGMLAVGHTDESAFGEHTMALLGSFSRAAAAAIANALEFQHERRIAGALTRGFIPGEPPELEGYSLGFVYEPAEGQVSGGDLFGVWRLPSGALAVLVGDVSGKGLEVAAVSSMVRFFVEARTWDSDRPGVVMNQANAILRTRLPRGVALVTAFLAIIDDGVLRYANAGHVPPLVVARDGALRELPATGLPLGVQDDLRHVEHEVLLEPGELLFAATDGLIEARRDGQLFGLQRVSELVAAHALTLDPQALVELVHATAVSWAQQLSDDVAIIALQRDA